MIKVKIAKICCTLGPLIFFSRNFPSNKPNKEPIENGIAIHVLRVPEASEMNAPPAETIANTPREVATMDFMGRSVNLLSAGTRINPPPTPSKPDRNPALAPANIRALAQGTVQISFPMERSNWHGGALALCMGFPERILATCNSIRIETYISTKLNSIRSGVLGVFWASHKPKGDNSKPNKAINAAAL